MLTLKLPVNNAEAAASVLIEAANSRWEADALDLLPDGKSVCLRLAGPAPALEEISKEILARWPGEQLSPSEAESLWTGLREISWAHIGGPLVKVALTPAVVPVLDKWVRPLNGARVHVSAGGQVAFISLASATDAAVLNKGLRGLGLSGVTLRGDAPLWCGVCKRPRIASAVKQALDPQNRFPSLDN